MKKISIFLVSIVLFTLLLFSTACNKTTNDTTTTIKTTSTSNTTLNTNVDATTSISNTTSQTNSVTNTTSSTITSTDLTTYDQIYSVTYEINGHGVTPGNLNNVGSLPSILPELDETGYIFLGWYIDTGLTIPAVAGSALTSNTILYAKWTVDSSHTDAIGSLPARSASFALSSAGILKVYALQNVSDTSYSIGISKYPNFTTSTEGKILPYNQTDIQPLEFTITEAGNYVLGFNGSINIYVISFTPTSSTESTILFRADGLEVGNYTSNFRCGEVTFYASELYYFTIELSPRTIEEKEITARIKTLGESVQTSTLSTHVLSRSATCTKEGNLEYYICPTCGKYFSDSNCENELTNVTIPALSHTLTHYNRNEPTVTEPGNIEYWYCTVCEKYFSDENGLTEITYGETIIAATGSEVQIEYPYNLDFEDLTKGDIIGVVTGDSPYASSNDTSLYVEVIDASSSYQITSSKAIHLVDKSSTAAIEYNVPTPNIDTTKVYKVELDIALFRDNGTSIPTKQSFVEFTGSNIWLITNNSGDLCVAIGENTSYLTTTMTPSLSTKYHIVATFDFENYKISLSVNDIVLADEETFNGSAFTKLFFKTANSNTSDRSFTIDNISVYESTGTYTVTYNANNHGTTPASLSNVTSLPSTLPLLAEEGYLFGGWFTNEALTIPAVAGATITKNTTLYAKWTSTEIIIDDEDMMNYIDSLIENTENGVPAWNMESYKGKWNYIDGVFLNSIVNLYYDLIDTNPTKAEGYKSFFITFVNYYIDEDGTFLNLSNPTLPGYTSGELDSVCESKILFDAYLLTNDLRYIEAIDYTYSQLTSLNTVSGSYGNYWHKTSYQNQIWLDGMYMYAPYYARYAYATNNTTILSAIVDQYEYIRDNMYNEDKDLYYHGYDSTKSIFWADSETGCSDNFWLRSMGWYIVSLVDIIEYYPEGTERTYLVNLLKEAVDGILQYQDTDTKMFYQIIDGIDSLGNPISVTVPASYFAGLGNTAYQQSGSYVDAIVSNYLESSGSSMVAYTILKAANRGYLTSSYKTIGEEIFEGIYDYAFDPTTNELNYICITAGLGPSTNQTRDGSIYYYLAEKVGSNDAKGVGPFIMAYLEYTYGSSATDVVPTPNITKYTVSFDSTGGTTVSSQTIIHGNKATSPLTSKDDYNFEGWYSDDSLETLFDFNTEITSSITLYAKWSLVTGDTYSITYAENGFGEDQTDLTNQHQIPISLPILTEAGYNFIGWYIDETCLVQAAEGTAITSNTVLYAKWEKITVNDIITSSLGTYSLVATVRAVNSQGFVVGDETGNILVYKGSSWTSNVNVGDSLLLTGTTALYGLAVQFNNTTTYTMKSVGNSVTYSDVTQLTGSVIDSYVTKTSVTLEYVTVTGTLTVSSNYYNLEVNGVTTTTLVSISYPQANSLLVNSAIIKVTGYFTGITGSSTKYINICAVSIETSPSAIEVQAYSEGAYIIWTDSLASSANAYYKLSSSTNYIQIDDELITQDTLTTSRVDFLGLPANKYDFKIELGNQTDELIIEGVNITNYDRSGYAHFNYSSGVGAYTDSGTLKSGAVVLYVTEENKNTVTLGSFTGIGRILANAGSYETPVCIRIVGKVSCATWDSLEVDVTSQEYLSGEITLSDNAMTRDTALGITTINGITNSISGGAGDWDSSWNQAYVNSANNWTIEGVGNAELFQWGIVFKKCNSIEVRNLTFTDYPEDACAVEGVSGNELSYSHYWIHNNTFNSGKNYWDLTEEQDKHYGDGATDFKYASNATFAYNVYNDCHKTGLVGGSNSNMQCNITFHHNYFNVCEQRVPLCRQANMHYYNNYYNGITYYCMSVRANGYVFSEANYFENCNQTIIIDTALGTPAVKSYNDVFTNCTKGGATTVSSRTEAVTNSCSYGTTFDTNSTLFYYDSENQVSNVEYLTTAAQAKIDVLAYSGTFQSNLLD